MSAGVAENKLLTGNETAMPKTLYHGASLLLGSVTGCTGDRIFVVFIKAAENPSNRRQGNSRRRLVSIYGHLHHMFRMSPRLLKKKISPCVCFVVLTSETAVSEFEIGRRHARR